jgi:hypothetical protein
MSRRRYTEIEKTGFLEEFERGGTSAAVFCREQGLPYQTFLSWRRGRSVPLPPSEPGRNAETEFVEVELSSGDGAAMQSAASPAVELVLGGGSILRIYPSPSQRP